MNQLIKNKDGLEAPQGYWGASRHDKTEATNGCGPRNFIGKIIPNSWFGTNIAEACNIHDWMWAKAENKKDYQKADSIFLKNMNLKIRNSKSSMFTKTIKKIVAKVYYFAVRIYGKFKN